MTFREPKPSDKLAYLYAVGIVSEYGHELLTLPHITQEQLEFISALHTKYLTRITDDAGVIVPANDDKEQVNELA